MASSAQRNCGDWRSEVINDDADGHGLQGTVTGPMLWDLFFEDARQSINDCLYTEVVYADDLNACRVFPHHIDNAFIDKNMDTCQKELHSWGAANQVAFDAAKGSRHILSQSDPSGWIWAVVSRPRSAHGARFAGRTLFCLFFVVRSVTGVFPGSAAAACSRAS